eukprot:437157-Prymnesium_polylepis.1
MEPLYDPPLRGEHSEPDRHNLTFGRLRPRTRYSFRLYATNAHGRSEPSARTLVSTLAPDPTISFAAPLAGPVRGGTRLRVHGADFAFGSVYKCRFGAHAVPATVITGDSLLRIPSPSSPAHAATASTHEHGEAAEAIAVREAPVLDSHSGAHDGGSIAIECVTPAPMRPRASLPNGEIVSLSAFALPLYVSVDGTQY